MEQRRESAYEAVEAANLDALVCFDGVSARWLTGFSGSVSTVIIDAAKEKTHLLVDSRYTESGRQLDCVSSGHVKLHTIESASQRGELVAKICGRNRVGVVGSRTTLTQAEELRSAGGQLVELMVDPLLEKRLVKDTDEVASMQKAIDIAERAFAHVTVLLTTEDGVSEKDVKATLDSEMLAGGADEVGFDTIVASGVNSLSPHATPTDKVIDQGEFIVIDFGASVNGYKSDTARTLWLGELSEAQARVFDAVHQAHQAASEMLRPHNTFGEVKKAADEVLAQHGFAEYSLHPFGHNVGLEIHERPYFMAAKPDGDIELKTGMVVALEPAVYVKGAGGVRLENLIHVTEDGPKVLNSMPLRVEL